MTTLLYRIAHPKDELGPYYGLYRDQYRFDDGTFDDDRPVPTEDGCNALPPGSIRSEWIFGFSSMAQLMAWFDAPRRSWLQRMGFRVEVWEADHVLRCGHQALFHKSAMCRVLRIEELTQEV